MVYIIFSLWCTDSSFKAPRIVSAAANTSSGWCSTGISKEKAVHSSRGNSSKHRASISQHAVTDTTKETTAAAVGTISTPVAKARVDLKKKTKRMGPPSVDTRPSHEGSGAIQSDIGMSAAAEDGAAKSVNVSRTSTSAGRPTFNIESSSDDDSDTDVEMDVDDDATIVQTNAEATVINCTDLDATVVQIDPDATIVNNADSNSVTAAPKDTSKDTASKPSAATPEHLSFETPRPNVAKGKVHVCVHWIIRLYIDVNSWILCCHHLDGLSQSLVSFVLSSAPVFQYPTLFFLITDAQNIPRGEFTRCFSHSSEEDPFYGIDKAAKI